MSRVSPSQKKVLHKLLREYLALRDGDKCLRCGTTQRLQMSHIYPKGTHRKMEWDPENLKLLCMKDHLFWWHKNPIEAWKWLERTIPPERLKRLEMRANSVDKTPFDYKMEKIFLQDAINKILRTINKE